MKDSRKSKKAKQKKALENGRIDIHIQLKKDDDANSFDKIVQL